MNKLSKKFSTPVPKNTTLIYCDQKKILIVVGPLTTKLIKLKLKLEFAKNNQILHVTSEPFFKLSNKTKKTVKHLRGTTLSLIKQTILETSIIIFKALKLVGVGYKVFYSSNIENKLLLFKLGYSHSIYFRVPLNLTIFCLKQTKLFLYGNSFQDLTQTASLIRSCKLPEPYKGKGILYSNEKIKLKEGKKT